MKPTDIIWNWKTFIWLFIEWNDPFWQNWEFENFDIWVALDQCGLPRST